LLKRKGRIDARQYAAVFVTQCTLSLNDSGWCQCGSFVMFCAPNAKILTKKKSFLTKNPVRSPARINGHQSAKPGGAHGERLLGDN